MIDAVTATCILVAIIAFGLAFCRNGHGALSSFTKPR